MSAARTLPAPDRYGLHQLTINHSTTTIPRAQGLTPASVMVDLSDVRHVDGLAYETAGLAYTALARATDADALWLRGGLPADT